MKAHCTECNLSKSIAGSCSLCHKPMKVIVGEMNKILIQHLENIGKAKERIITLLGDDYFDYNLLSKHSAKWDSTHERESELLDEARRKISWLTDELWDVIELFDVRNIEEDRE